MRMVGSCMYSDVGKNILYLPCIQTLAKTPYIFQIKRAKENCTFFNKEHHCIQAIIFVVVTVSTMEDKSQ